jgi:hypothetical protein
MNSLGHRVEVREHEEGFAFVEIPLDLLEVLGWQINDEVLVEETEVADDDGETQGLVISRPIN